MVDNNDGGEPTRRRRVSEKSAQHQQVLEELTRPEHSKAENFHHLYVVDADFCVRLANEIIKIAGSPPDWTIRFHGMQTLRGSNIANMLAEGVVQHRAIESITVSLVQIDKTPVCKFELNLGGSSKSAEMDVSARDAAVFERLRATVRDMLPAARRRGVWWLQTTSATWLLLVSTLLFSGTIAASTCIYFEFSPFLGFFITLPVFIFTIFVITYLLTHLFPNVEFDIGYSRGQIEHRKWLRGLVLWPFAAIASGLFGSAAYALVTMMARQMG